MTTGLAIGLIVAAAVVFGVVGFVAGGINRKRVAEAAIGSAEDEANRILSQAVSEAESKKKEAILEAKDEIHKQRNDLEREIKDRKSVV